MKTPIICLILLSASYASADITPLQSFPARSQGDCPPGTVYYADVHQCYCYTVNDCEVAKKALLEKKKKQEEQQRQRERDQLVQEQENRLKEQEQMLKEQEQMLKRQEQRLKNQEKRLEEQDKMIRDHTNKTEKSPK